MISDLGFSFLDRNSKFLDRIFIFLEIKTWVWVLIKHYSCLIVSCFLFRFLFLLCVWISVSNLVSPHCKKKKGLPETFPIETWHSAGPIYPKKNCLAKKISFVVFFIIRVYLVFSILFLRLVCHSYLWLCQINLNLVRVPILGSLGVCVWQLHRVCFLFSLKVSWYQIWDFRFLIVFLNFLIESWFFLKSKVESGF